MRGLPVQLRSAAPARTSAGRGFQPASPFSNVARGGSLCACGAPNQPWQCRGFCPRCIRRAVTGQHPVSALAGELPLKLKAPWTPQRARRPTLAVGAGAGPAERAQGCHRHIFQTVHCATLPSTRSTSFQLPFQRDNVVLPRSCRMLCQNLRVEGQPVAVGLRYEDRGRSLGSRREPKTPTDWFRQRHWSARL